MVRVDYDSVLFSSADLCGLDRSNLPTADFSQLRSAHSRRLRVAWEYDFWPDVIRTEKRYFRPLYLTATAYTAGTEVYWNGKYYQALTATTGNDPADVNGITQTAFWADAATGFTASRYDNAVTYLRGERVYYPYTDRFYQLFAVSSVGNLPSDTSRWGVLTEFDAYVGYDQTGFTPIGSVLAVDSGSQKLTTRTDQLGWWLSENGVQISGSVNASSDNQTVGVSFAVIQFRLRSPFLKGALWSSGTSYVVGDQVYYSTGVPGNFYDCIQATSSAAPTNASFWTRVDIPRIFTNYMEIGAYADWLRNTGQSDRADGEDRRAQQELEYQRELLVGGQSQRKRALVVSR